MEIDQRLVDVRSEFARTLLTDFPVQAILDHLVVRVLEMLPVRAAGVTLMSPGSDPHYIVASDDLGLRLEQLQTDVGEGPCLTAYGTGHAVTVPDVRSDVRFPQFSPRALQEGLMAAFAFPLSAGDSHIGALALYRTTSGLLDDGAMAAAQMMADAATASLLNAWMRNELEESRGHARHRLLHDTVTGLPNQTLLVQRLDHAILRCRRSGKMVAILFADLDNFTAINDTYGHNVGDELLGAVAERLTGLLRPGDTLARLGDEEFVILCEDLDDAAQVEPIAARIQVALTEAFVLSCAVVRAGARVGIAFAGQGDEIPERVLHDADTAMSRATCTGGARHRIVDLREQPFAHHRASLILDLPGALARGELRSVYQPIVATGDGRITGVEALLRWAHPTLGIVAPESVVPLADQSGLIVEIGRWVLERACMDRHRWKRHDHQSGQEIFINVSVHQLMAPDFAATVSAVLTATHTDPTLVTLEITESVFIQDSQRALVVLKDLKRLGVMIALDDFGTGYSSLSYLNRFPVDIVKIDRAFVANLSREPTSRLIVKTIVGLAHELGMRVVAEGIESADQYEEVLALGCDAYQGFYFARPTSADNLDALMAATA